MDALERERAENTELRNRLQRLDAQYNAFVSGERELVALNEQLERDAGELRAELDRVRQSAQRDHDHADQLAANARAAWMEEKCHLQSRIEELDVQLAESRKKLAAATAAYKQVPRHFTNVPIPFFITFRVSHRQREMYCGHARLSVCLSVRGCMPTLLHGPGCNLGEW